MTSTIVDDLASSTRAFAELNERLQLASHVLQSVTDDLASFESLLQECGSQVEGLFDEVAQTLEELIEIHETASDHLDTSIESFEAALEDVATSMDELRASLQEQLQTVVKDSIGTIEEVVLEPVIEVRDNCVAKIQALLDELVDDAIPAKISEIQAEWMKQLQDQLSDMIAVLTGSLDEFRQSVIAGSDSSQKQRDDAKMIMDQFEQLLAPVMDALGSFKSLADSVGISIG